MAGAALARLRARRRIAVSPDERRPPAGASQSSSAKRRAITPHYLGHRERLRQRLIEAGAESLPDYELLEVILFASNPRGDVKPLAKELLDHFGGFAAVVSAEPDALFAAGLGLGRRRRDQIGARGGIAADARRTAGPAGRQLLGSS